MTTTDTTCQEPLPDTTSRTTTPATRGHGARPWKLLPALLLALGAPGCMLFGGVQVDTVATSAEKPSNVAMYVTVSRSGAPVKDLTAESFVVTEDGQELSAEQTQQTLLPRETAAVHRALLLLDMSGPVTEGETRQRIAEAAAHFVAMAHVNEPVTVYAFDGGTSIRLLGEFPQGPDDVREIPGLATYTPTDPSSNLNGAIVDALTQLDARLMTAQKPVRIGTLVVFGRGPDLAGRVPESKMLDALDDSRHRVFAIGIEDVPGFRASRIGRDGEFEADSAVSLLHAFDAAGHRVADTVLGHYLFSYCSPSRAGQRRVRLRITTADEEGKEVSGTTSAEFDATGFTSGCDPRRTPHFVEQPRPVKTEDEKESKPSGKPRPAPAGGARPAGTGAPAASPGEDDAVVPPPAKPGYAP